MHHPLLSRMVLFISDLCSDKTVDFTMKYARFLEFLDAWQAVYDKNPALITISMEPDHDLFT